MAIPSFLANLVIAIPYMKRFYQFWGTATRRFEKTALNNFGEPIFFFAHSSFLSGKWSAMDKAGRYEAPLAEKFYESLNDDSVVFDVGASVGIYTLIAAQKTQKIHCFEPNGYLTVLLKKNVRLANVTAKIIQKFVSNRNSFQTITIDSYCQQTRTGPTHIKMDIEGHEIFACQGMTETLTQFHPSLFIEFHENIIKRLGFTDIDITNFFQDLVNRGYKLSFNSHLYDMCTSKERIYRDFNWHSRPPNHINYACIGRSS